LIYRHGGQIADYALLVDGEFAAAERRRANRFCAGDLPRCGYEQHLR
jgi:hypothetical protein